MKFFESALTLLRELGELAPDQHSPGANSNTSDQFEKQAYDLLLGLKYFRTNKDQQIELSTRDFLLLENRTALLRLASKLSDAFQLSSSHAPGAYFFGGMVNVNESSVAAKDANLISVGGRGETFKTAFESCMGEAAEARAFLRMPTKPQLVDLTPDNKLKTENLKWALDGIGADGIDLKTLQWVNTTSLLNLSTKAFPAEIVFRYPEKSRIGRRAAESNGVAAGITKYDAILSALLEIAERDAAALWWYGEQKARLIDRGVEHKLGFSGFTKKVRGASSRRYWLLDITSDLAIPVVASLSARNDGSAVISGLSAGVTIFDAMKSAFLEMCQMELAQKISVNKLERKEHANLHDQDLKWIKREKHLSLDNFPRLKEGDEFTFHSTQTQQSKLDFVLSSLSDKGFHPFFVDLTLKTDKIPVVRAIIPGLQSTNIDWLTSRLAEKLTRTDPVSIAALSKLAPF